MMTLYVPKAAYDAIVEDLKHLTRTVLPAGGPVSVIPVDCGRIVVHGTDDDLEIRVGELDYLSDE